MNALLDPNVKKKLICVTYLSKLDTYNSEVLELFSFNQLLYTNYNSAFEVY